MATSTYNSVNGGSVKSDSVTLKTKSFAVTSVLSCEKQGKEYIVKLLYKVYLLCYSIVWLINVYSSEQDFSLVSYLLMRNLSPRS